MKASPSRRPRCPGPARRSRRTGLPSLPRPARPAPPREAPARTAPGLRASSQAPDRRLLQACRQAHWASWRPLGPRKPESRPSARPQPQARPQRRETPDPPGPPPSLPGTARRTRLRFDRAARRLPMGSRRPRPPPGEPSHPRAPPRRPLRGAGRVSADRSEQRRRLAPPGPRPPSPPPRQPRPQAPEPASPAGRPRAPRPETAQPVPAREAPVGSRRAWSCRRAATRPRPGPAAKPLQRQVRVPRPAPGPVRPRRRAGRWLPVSRPPRRPTRARRSPAPRPVRARSQALPRPQRSPVWATAPRWRSARGRARELRRTPVPAPPPARERRPVPAPQQPGPARPGQAPARPPRARPSTQARDRASLAKVAPGSATREQEAAATG